MDIVTEWKALVADIRAAAFGMFAKVEVAKTERGFADEKVLALILLARTISNVKGALLLLDAKHIVEARTITRCVFENLYWIIGLAEEGEAFVRKMRDDEMSHRRTRGQEIFGADVQLADNVAERLRAYLKGSYAGFWVTDQLGGVL